MSAIEQWLPHREPFLFVDELVEVTGEAGRFVLELSASDARLTDGYLQPLFLVEALAQCTAALNGYTRAGKAEAGLLAEVQGSFFSAAKGGERVELEVRRLREHGALGRYRCRATVGERVLVEADLTVARAPEEHG